MHALNILAAGRLAWVALAAASAELTAGREGWVVPKSRTVIRSSPALSDLAQPRSFGCGGLEVAANQVMAPESDRDLEPNSVEAGCSGAAIPSLAAWARR